MDDTRDYQLDLMRPRDIETYPHKITVHFADDASGPMQHTRKMLDRNKCWLDNKDIPCKVNLLCGISNSLHKNYYFTDKNHALLFSLSCGD